MTLQEVEDLKLRGLRRLYGQAVHDLQVLLNDPPESILPGHDFKRTRRSDWRDYRKAIRQCLDDIERLEQYERDKEDRIEQYERDSANREPA